MTISGHRGLSVLRTGGTEGLPADEGAEGGHGVQEGVHGQRLRRG